jgi:hypothetical protein
MPTGALRPLIERWREDPGATYRTWFLWEERLKNFRSIRRGLQAVVREIADGTFGNQYRGSSLETVVGSIAEQRQIFKGADHAFLWKPEVVRVERDEEVEDQIVVTGAAAREPDEKKHEQQVGGESDEEDGAGLAGPACEDCHEARVVEDERGE